jgi:hypothetical protein
MVEARPFDRGRVALDKEQVPLARINTKKFNWPMDAAECILFLTGTRRAPPKGEPPSCCRACARRRISLCRSPHAPFPVPEPDSAMNTPGG